MQIVQMAEAIYLSTQSHWGKFKSRQRLFELSVKRFENAVRTMPGNDEVNLRYGNSLLEYSMTIPDGDLQLKFVFQALHRYKEAKAYKSIFELAQLISELDRFLRNNCEIKHKLFELAEEW